MLFKHYLKPPCIRDRGPFRQTQWHVQDVQTHANNTVSKSSEQKFGGRIL